jgi:hypothetical protein
MRSPSHAALVLSCRRVPCPGTAFALPSHAALALSCRRVSCAGTAFALQINLSTKRASRKHRSSLTATRTPSCGTMDRCTPSRASLLTATSPGRATRRGLATPFLASTRTTAGLPTGQGLTRTSLGATRRGPLAVASGLRASSSQHRARRTLGRALCRCLYSSCCSIVLCLVGSLLHS